MLPSPNLPPNRVQPISGMPPQFSRPMMPFRANGGRMSFASGGVTVANSSVPALSGTSSPSTNSTSEPFSSVVADVPLSALVGGSGGNGVIAPVNNQGMAQGNTPSLPRTVANNVFATQPPASLASTNQTSQATPAGPAFTAQDQFLLNFLASPHASGGRINKASGGNIPQYRKEYAFGGPPTSSEMAPWYTRAEERGDQIHTGGLFGGSAPGRADTLPVSVIADSHVVPADVVSGLGDGNTLSGASVIDKMLTSEPYGIRLPHGHASPLRLPSAPRAPSDGYWEGGRHRDHTGRKTVPIAASSGEYNVPPEGVYKIGLNAAKRMKLEPNKLTARKVMDLGHDILDKWIVEMRKRTIAKMRKLPPPKKD